MKEKLVSFEVAKLAKEKGFDQNLDVGVFCRLQNKVNSHYENVRTINESDLENDWCIFNEIYPTQSLLQKWLREEHNIHIELIIDGWGKDECVSDEYLCYRAFIWQVGKPKPGPAEDLGASDYEHILEIALKEALKLI